MIIGKITRKIEFPLYIIFILQLFFSKEICFLISSLYLFLQIITHKKLYLPKLGGLLIFVIFIIYGSILGIISCSIREIFRDYIYILPSFIWLFIGFYKCRKDEKSYDKLINTLIIYGITVSIKCIFDLVCNFTMNFDDLRKIFNVCISDVSMIAGVVLYCKIAMKKIFFGKNFDWILLGGMLIQILLSFGRISILEFFIIVFGAFVFKILIQGKNKKAIKGFIKVFCITIIVIMIIFTIIPEDVTYRFMLKLAKSFEEINTTVAISSVKDAMNNWRSYEMQQAFNQWNEGGIGYKILGNGIGSGVHIEYVPYTWTDIAANNQIPILHNGFYTILFKGGIVGLFSLLMIFFSTIVIGYKLLKYTVLKDMGAIMISISISCIACTYVVRGIVEKGGFLAWGIFVGSFLGVISLKNKKKEILDEKSLK